MKYNFGLGTNDDGNLLSITNNKDSNRSVSYTYDSLNRIASATTANADCTLVPNTSLTKNWGESFTIDAWGNLTNRTVTKCSAEPLSVTAISNNRLSGFGYDSAGDMTSNGSASYNYDAESRLKTAAGVTYTYDGDGNRVAKSNGTLYWGEGPLLESDLGGNLLREFVFAGDQRIARRDLPDGTVHYFFSDHLGSTHVQTTANGAIQNDSDYYPYGGERVYALGTANQNYKFTGKERDSESGLDNFLARYDSSTLGRFMTPDWSDSADPVPFAELGNPQTLNLYAYVENNPGSATDPSGHDDPCAKSKNPGNCIVVNGSPPPPIDLQQILDEFKQSLQTATQYGQQLVDAFASWKNAPRDQNCMVHATAAGAGMGGTVGFGLGALGGGTAGGFGGSVIGPEGTLAGAGLGGSAGAAKGTAIGIPAGAAVGYGMGLFACKTAGGGGGSGGGAAGGGGGGGGGKSGSFWKSLKNFRGKTKTNGLSGSARRFYEWDHTHGDVEVYNGRGQHLGTVDPETGVQTKPAVPGRRITI